MRWRDFLGQSGFSLISVLGGVGIFSVICLALLLSMSGAINRTRISEQNQAISNLKSYLLSALSDGSVCSMVMTTAGPWAAIMPLSFDETLVGTSSPPRISFNRIPESARPGAPAIVARGTIANQLDYLLVEGIEVVVTGGSGQVFSGELNINFDAAKLGRSVRPIQIDVAMTTNNTSPRQITGCTISGPGRGSLHRRIFDSSGTFVVPAGTKVLKVAVVGGGGGGGGGVDAARSMTTGWTCVSGGSGGGGGTAICVVDVVPGTTYSIAVGNGGAAGTGTGVFGAATPATNGGAGGSSQFGNLCRATGGSGGRFGVPAVFTASNMSGGLGGAGSLIPGATVQSIEAVNGLPGNWGLYINNCWQERGIALSQFGGSAYGGLSVYGTGGFGGDAGGDFGNAGQAGQGGVVIVEWVN